MLRVIGAGFGRTGTYSLKVALEQLGFGPAYHMLEVFEHPEHIAVWQEAGEGKPVEWHRLFDGYQSAVDWPASAFYRDLMSVYPEAKVILTVRDPERWHESGRNTIFPERERGPEEDVPAVMREHGRMIRTIMWDGIFDGRVLDRAHAVEVFQRHNQTVQEKVPPERLLVYDVKEGWEPLCSFLSVPMPPGQEFPRLNDTAAFKERRELRRLRGQYH
jgi:Sulfotransferase domain